MIDLLHLGDPTARHVHMTRLYLHWAYKSPEGSDERLMWMRCAFSENVGVCPKCVDHYKAEREQFNLWLLGPRGPTPFTNRDGSRAPAFKSSVTCFSKGCANNPRERMAQLQRKRAPRLTENQIHATFNRMIHGEWAKPCCKVRI
jgi:hypothetical protein